MLDLHDAVKKACKDKNIAITELASNMGINRSSIYSITKGGNPRIKSVENIADALDLKLSTLIEMAE